jgi:hypothetical protein
VKKAVAITAVVLLIVLVVGALADRVTANAAERTITDRIEQSFHGASSVSTSIAGVPILTQVARGSLDHVTVTLGGVDTGKGLVLESVVADLYDVTTSAPRTAARVVAHADIATSELQKQLGDAWTITPDGDAFAVRWSGPLPVTARVVPTVRDGKLALDLDSVTVLGVSVDGSSVPAVVTDRINALAASAGALPLGLTPTSVTVTPTGARVVATGTDVDLESA